MLGSGDARKILTPKMVSAHRGLENVPQSIKRSKYKIAIIDGSESNNPRQN